MFFNKSSDLCFLSMCHCKLLLVMPWSAVISFMHDLYLAVLDSSFLCFNFNKVLLYQTSVICIVWSEM